MAESVLEHIASESLATSRFVVTIYATFYAQKKSFFPGFYSFAN